MKVKLHKISALLSLLLGFVLIVLGGFYTNINWTQISTASTLYKLKAKQEVQIEEIESYIQIKKKSADQSFDGTLFQDLALAEFVLSNQYGYFSQKGKDLLISSRKNLQKGLSLSPASSYSWYRLAYINMLLDGVTRDVSNALYMSMILSSHEYAILYQRLNYAFLTWDYFSDEEKYTIHQQIRLGWKWSEWNIAKLAKSEKTKQILIAALGYLPENVDLLDKRIGQLRKEGKL